MVTRHVRWSFQRQRQRQRFGQNFRVLSWSVAMFLVRLSTRGLSFTLRKLKLGKFRKSADKTRDINLLCVSSLEVGITFSNCRHKLTLHSNSKRRNKGGHFLNLFYKLVLNDAYLRLTLMCYERAFWVQKLVLPLLYKGIATSNPRSTLVRLKTKGNRPMLADAR